MFYFKYYCYYYCFFTVHCLFSLIFYLCYFFESWIPIERIYFCFYQVFESYGTFSWELPAISMRKYSDSIPTI